MLKFVNKMLNIVYNIAKHCQISFITLSMNLYKNNIIFFFD